MLNNNLNDQKKKKKKNTYNTLSTLACSSNIQYLMAQTCSIYLLMLFILCHFVTELLHPYLLFTLMLIHWSLFSDKFEFWLNRIWFFLNFEFLHVACVMCDFAFSIAHCASACIIMHYDTWYKHIYELCVVCFRFALQSSSHLVVSRQHMYKVGMFECSLF